ncbi:hypothetical protein NE865_09052 [Phthorimaea operculella]|nr:hypothetical protein NE865_09052 [Phthorimaea operculella]
MLLTTHQGALKMKLSVFLGSLLVGLALSAPTAKDDKLVVDKDFFPDELKIYEGQHDIVKIYVPINKLNFEDDDNPDIIIFFVTADTQGGEKFYQGLYVKKGDNVTKLLDNGRDVIAPVDEDSEDAFFAAKDGIYQYNAKENKAEKYGTVDDELIAMAMVNATNGIYVLTADKKVYKVTEDGTKKEEVENVKDAEQIVLDYSGNLFYVDSNKKVFVVNGDGVTEITSLPENFAKITLIRPPFVFESGIPVVIDQDAYTLHANGTLENEDIKIDVDVTAYSMEAALMHYYAHDKKIYEYNILALLFSNILAELRQFIEDFQAQIQSVSTKHRSEFMNNNI